MCKDSASRVERKEKRSFSFSSEAPPNLREAKDSANERKERGKRAGFSRGSFPGGGSFKRGRATIPYYIRARVRAKLSAAGKESCPGAGGQGLFRPDDALFSGAKVHKVKKSSHRRFAQMAVVQCNYAPAVLNFQPPAKKNPRCSCGNIKSPYLCTGFNKGNRLFYFKN